MKYAWIEKQRRSFPLPVLCEALSVSQSGFRAWQARWYAEPQATDRRSGVDADPHDPSGWFSRRTVRDVSTPSCADMARRHHKGLRPSSNRDVHRRHPRWRAGFHARRFLAKCAARAGPRGPDMSGIKAGWPRFGTKHGTQPAGPAAERRDERRPRRFTAQRIRPAERMCVPEHDRLRPNRLYRSPAIATMGTNASDHGHCHAALFASRPGQTFILAPSGHARLRRRPPVPGEGALALPTAPVTCPDSSDHDLLGKNGLVVVA